MAMTLLEASKLSSGDVVRSGVIEMFAANSDILRAMPFLDVPGGSYNYNQEGTLPGVAFRGVNEAYTESVGVVNPQVEVLRIGGGDLDVDKALLKMHGDVVRTTHEAAKVKAMALYLTKKIIKGDSVSEPREFDGLQNRLTGSQLISNSGASAGIGLSLAKLDEAIDAVDSPTHLIMSKAMRRRLSAAARNTSVGGYIDYAQDEFGNRVTLYDGLPILIADYDDVGARILDFSELEGDGSSTDGTSVYCVSFAENMLTGLQNGMMEVSDLGEIDDKPVVRTRVEWLVGLAALHGRCASRLYSVIDAAVTV